MLKSKIVGETLKAKGYDLNQVETGDAQINEDLMRLLEKLAEDKPVIQEEGAEEPEVTILRRKADGKEDSSKERKEKSYSHWLIGSLRTYLKGLWSGRRRYHSRGMLSTWDWVKSPGSGTVQRKMLRKNICPGSVKDGMKTQRKATMIKIVYA